MFSGGVQEWAGPDDIAGSGKWARARVEIVDPGLSRLPEVPVPGLVTGVIRQAEGADGAVLPLSGRVMLRIPDTFQGKVFPGDVLEASGVLSSPRGSFGRYTASRRVKWIYSVDECRIVDHNRHSWRRILALGREKLLSRAVMNIASPERRMAFASLFFGIRGGLDGTEKQKLIHAGVIHLYSVSGLHVGILAGVLMILLRGLPGNWKYGLLIPATLLYVLSTGANVPAVRAWIMISVWAGCRMFLHWMPVCRVLGYSAALMLIWQPVWLYDMGFLYSFVITWILLLLGQNLHLFRKHLSDPAWLMPRSPMRKLMYRRLGIRNAFLSALFACTAAFLGGTVIGLLFQGRFLPGAVLANLLLMPVVGVLFPVMALKLATGWLWNVWDIILAKIMDLAWNIMDGIIALLQYFDATVTGVPPWWSAVLFFVGLILFFAPACRPKWRITGGVLCCGILIFWHGAMYFCPPAVMVVHGNYAEVPAVAVADTRSGVGIVVNVPDGASAAKIAEFFLEHGITVVDRVLASAPRSGNIRGLKTLAKRIRIRQLVLPEMDRYSGGFRRVLRETLPEIPDLPTVSNSGNVRLGSGEGYWGVDYSNPASRIRCRIQFHQEPETMTIQGKIMPLLRSSESVAQVFSL